MIGAEEIDQAVRIATLCAVLVATALTYLVYRVHRFVFERTGMRLLALVVALILSVGVYAACDTTRTTVTYFQLYQAHPKGLLAERLFIHPGALQKIVPAVTIAGTWWLLSASRKRRVCERPAP